MANYYVATNGSNGNNGISLATPWATWQYGVSQLYPGDTLFIRAGNYTSMYGSSEGVNINPSSGRGRNGSSGIGNRITVQGYPGEAMPVLDCTSLTSGSEHNGMLIENLSYLDFKKLEIKNCKNRGSNQPAPGITFSYCSNINIEWCTLHDNDNGFISYSGNEIRFINCDSYSNGKGSPYLGNNGFYARCSESNTTYFIGCRAWDNGQDGYDVFAAPGTGGGYIYWDKCWSFDNSQTYSGTGFKMGTNRAPSVSSNPQRVLTNCISVNNPIGYDESQDEGLGYSVPISIYNCVSYNNTAGFNFQWYEGLEGSFYPDIIKNCISYQDGTLSLNNWKEHGTNRTIPNVIENNSWNIRTVQESDFINTEYSQLYNQRQEDGSLPIITFLHLSAAATDFITAGADVDLSTDGEGNNYDANHPSIGCYQYNAGSPVPVEEINVTASEATITTNDGTLQMSAEILPEDSTYQNILWSVVPGSGTASINSSGLLSALTNGTVTVRADALDSSGVYGTMEITISNQLTDIKVTSLILSGGNSITVNAGTLQKYVTALPENATDKSVTWSIYNGTGNATIDQNGLITAVRNGIVTVRVTANDSI